MNDKTIQYRMIYNTLFFKFTGVHVWQLFNYCLELLISTVSFLHNSAQSRKKYWKKALFKNKIWSKKFSIMWAKFTKNLKFKCGNLFFTKLNFKQVRKSDFRWHPWRVTWNMHSQRMNNFWNGLFNNFYWQQKGRVHLVWLCGHREKNRWMFCGIHQCLMLWGPKASCVVNILLLFQLEYIILEFHIVCVVCSNAAPKNFSSSLLPTKLSI